MNRFRNTSAAIFCGWLFLLVSFCPFFLTRSFGQTAQSFFSSLRSSDAQGSKFEASSTHQPVTPETQGDIHMANKRYVDAINAYQLGPSDSAVIWNKLGVAYHHLLAFNVAKKNYEKALKINPKYPEALNNLGSIYYEEKNYGRAEKLYNKSLKLKPDCAITYSNLGTAYFAHRKYQQGTAAYQKALSLDPLIFERDSLGKVEHQSPPGQKATVSYYLAKTYAQAGMKDKAIEYLRQAFANGFSDRKKLMEDEEFSALRKTPEFRKLLEEEKLNWLS
jgi:tetratricopeptide (TPR) repeat protein